MSLFQCRNCGCVENTAMSHQGFTMVDHFDWTLIPELKGKKLCRMCGPKKFSDGRPIENLDNIRGFKRTFLPKGEFTTNRQGNLQHKKTTRIDFFNFEVKENGDPIDKQEAW